MSYIESMRRRRSASAVTKTEFATFASGVPSTHLIFVFEGRDDKIAYAHWLRQIDHSLKYEALIKQSKAGVLKLFDALAEDLTGLSGRARYFVDRDFDDLQGHEPSESIFMTDRYAIENYCVTSEVLKCLLQEEFHCNGLTDVRQQVVDLFENVYADFLLKTQLINLRIFFARRLGIAQDDKLPNRLNQIAVVNLRNTQRVDGELSGIVLLIREPTEEEIARISPEFFELDPATRYRGKFALMFFSRWLELLRADRCAEASELFAAYGVPELKVKGDFSFERLVSRTTAPPGLLQFLKGSRKAASLATSA